MKKDNEEQKVNDPGRRSALKKMAVGAGAVAGISLLPDKWSIPVVESIVVPAHAETSGPAPLPSVTVTIINNSSLGVGFDYTGPSGTEEVGNLATLSSLTVQAKPLSEMIIHPEGHVGFLDYVGDGVASTLVIDISATESRFIGNLGPGASGTVTITDSRG
ncbi:hypothetical protein [Desulforhopalus singaporensis]|uniref:Uncharacterized protein n=1 Tax=Desulforhopalus singaporensis TaxID=91360 RepID=A0A1H0NSM9_9BACT|nr:hypothetical protein [Desulforhopalus singaporensis]SDO95475.1 hypothetical protein SAMN05660330_01422 [Desulforhopalus singaporensis]